MPVVFCNFLEKSDGALGGGKDVPQKFFSASQNTDPYGKQSHFYTIISLDMV